MLKLGQHVHLLRVHFLVFMSVSGPMAGSAVTWQPHFYGLRASVTPRDGWPRKPVGSRCDQTPPRNLLKFGQNVHLWRVQFLAFMSESFSVAGLVITRGNVISYVRRPVGRKTSFFPDGQSICYKVAPPAPIWTLIGPPLK